MTKREPGMYIARSSGVVKVGGKRREYTARLTIVRHDDPILNAIPDRFMPLETASPQGRLLAGVTMAERT